MSGLYARLDPVQNTGMFLRDHSADICAREAFW